MEEELDPDLLLAFALSFPLMERGAGEKPLYDSALSQLLTMIQETSCSSLPREGRAIDFVFKDYFVQLLEVIVNQQYSDPTVDMNKKLSMLESILQNSYVSSFTAETTYFLIKLLATLSSALMNDSYFNLIFQSVNRSSSFYRFTKTYLKYCLCVLEKISSPKQSYVEPGPSIHGLETKTLTEMRILITDILCALCQWNARMIGQTPDVKQLMKNIPAFPDQLFRDSNEDIDTELSVLERFQEAQQDAVRRADSYYHTIHRSWVDNNAKLLCNDLNGFHRIVESCVSCLKEKYSDVANFCCDSFIEDTKCFDSLLSFLVSHKTMIHSVNQSVAAVSVQLCQHFIESYLIMLSVPSYVASTTHSMTEKLNKILSVVEFTAGETVKRNCQVYILHTISKFMGRSKYFDEEEIFSTNFTVTENNVLMESGILSLFVSICESVLLSHAPSFSMGAELGKDFDCMQMYSYEQILDFLSGVPLFHHIVSTVLVLYKECCVRVRKNEDQNKEDDYDYSDDDEDNDDQMNDYLDGGREYVDILVFASKLLQGLFVTNEQFLSKFVNPSINDTHLVGLLFISKCQSSDTCWSIPDGEKVTLRSSPLIVSSEFDFHVRQIWTGLIGKCLQDSHRAVILQNVGYQSKSFVEGYWPLCVPSEQVAIISKLILCEIQRVNSRDSVIMQVWNGVLRSLRDCLLDSSYDSTEILIPEYSNLLINIFHLLNDINKEQVIRQCISLLLENTNNRSARYFIAKARIVIFVHYFLFHYTTPAENIESCLEDLFSDETSKRTIFSFGTVVKNSLNGNTLHGIPLVFYHAYKIPTSKQREVMDPKAGAIILENQTSETYYRRYTQFLSLLEHRLYFDSLPEGNQVSPGVALVVYENYFQLVWEFISQIPMQAGLWQHVEQGFSNDVFVLPTQNGVLLYLFWFTQRIFEQDTAPLTFHLSHSLDYYLRQFLGLVSRVHKQITENLDLTLFKSLSVIDGVYVIFQYLVICMEMRSSGSCDATFWGTKIIDISCSSEHLEQTNTFFRNEHASFLSILLSSLEIFHRVFLRAREQQLKKITAAYPQYLEFVKHLIDCKISVDTSKQEDGSPLCIVSECVSQLSKWIWEAGEACPFKSKLTPSENMERVIWSLLATPHSNHFSQIEYAQSIVLFLQSAATLCKLYTSMHFHMISPNDRERIARIFVTLQHDIPSLSKLSFDVLMRFDEMSSFQRSAAHKMKKIKSFFQFFMSNESLCDSSGPSKYQVFEPILVAGIREISSDIPNSVEILNFIPCMILFRLLILNTSPRVTEALGFLNKLLGQNEKFLFQGNMEALTSLPPDVIVNWVKRNFVDSPRGTIDTKNVVDPPILDFTSAIAPNSSDIASPDLQKVITRLVFTLSRNRHTAQLIFQTLVNSFEQVISQSPDIFLNFFVVLKHLANQNLWAPEFLSKSIQALASFECKTDLQYANVSIVVGFVQRIFQLLDPKTAGRHSTRCTALVHDKNFVKQHWYYCYTCDLTFSKGICAVCADECHKGHEISYARESSFLCDCNTVSNRACSAQEDPSRLEELLHSAGSSVDLFKSSILQKFKEEQTENQFIRYVHRLFDALQAEKSAPLAIVTENIELSTTVEIPTNFSVKLKGDSVGGREIKQYRSNFMVTRRLLDISGRGFFGIAERTNLTIGAVPYLFNSKGSDSKKTFVVIEGCQFSFHITQLLFHPTNGEYLVVAGLHDCVVVSVNSSGTITNKLNVHFAINGSDDPPPPIIQVLWLPEEQTKLMIVTTKFLKIFDLAEDNKEATHYFSGLHDQFQSVCFLPSYEQPMKVLILSKAGRIFTQIIPQQKQPEKLYVCSGISLPESLSHSLNDALAIHFSQTLSSIIVTFKDSQSFVGVLNDSHDKIVRSFSFACAGVHWTELSNHPGSFLCVEALHTLRLAQISDKFQSKALPFSVESYCVVPFNNGPGASDSLVAVALLKDGSLRAFSLSSSVFKNEEKPSDSPPIPQDKVQSFMDIRRKVLALRAEGSSEGRKNSMDSKRTRNPSAVFETMQCVTNDVTFSGDVLLYYSADEVKQRALENAQYLVSPNSSKCKIVVHYENSNMMISGVRVLVGHSSLQHIPRRLKVGDDTKVCKPNTRRWYEFPFSPDNQLHSPSEVTITAKNSHGKELVIDSIQIYAVTRDSVLCSPVGSFSSGQHEPRTLLEKAAVLATTALAQFYAVLPKDAHSLQTKQWKDTILPMLNNNSLIVLHSSLKKLLMSLLPSQAEYYGIIDHAQLAHITSELVPGPVSYSSFICYCGIIHNILMNRKENLKEHLKDIVVPLHSRFWEILKVNCSVFLTVLPDILCVLIGLLCEFVRLMDSEKGSYAKVSALELFEPFLLAEDDVVRIGATKEMLERLEITQDSEAPQEMEIDEVSFSCDHCGNTIKEYRYHCESCTDFDLCAKCNKKKRFHKSTHSKSHKVSKISIESQPADIMDEADDELKLAVAMSLGYPTDPPPSIFSTEALFLLWKKINNYHMALSFLHLLRQVFLATPQSEKNQFIIGFLNCCRPLKSQTYSEKASSVLLLGFIHSVFSQLSSDQLSSVLSWLVESEFIVELQKLLKLSQQQEISSNEPRKDETDANTGEILLTPHKEEFVKGYFLPFLHTEQIAAHTNKSELLQVDRLFTENIIQLIHIIYTKSKELSNQSLFVTEHWKEILCHILHETPKTTQPLYARTKTLLISFCGGKTKYHQFRDNHLYSRLTEKITQVKKASQDLRIELPYTTAVDLMQYLTDLWKQVNKRPAHWQEFLAANNQVLSLFWSPIPFLREEPALLALKIVAHAFTIPQDKDQGTSQVNPQPPLVDQIIQPIEKFANFVPKFLLECHTENIRVEACNLLSHLWICANASQQQLLTNILQDVIGYLSSFGRNGKQFFDLLSKIVTHKAAYELFVPTILESFRTQNQNLKNHPNSYLYRDLQSIVDLEGFYFEKEPCLVCNDTDAPYSDLKLDTMKSETKYTENSMIIKFSSSYTLERITVSLSALTKAKMIKTIHFYYNNKPIQRSSELTELRTNKSLWKKAKTSTLQPFQSQACIDFLVPITACNFMIEFAEFIEDENAKANEKLVCPRCNHTVRDKHGICELCRENAMQCRQCRNINYENLHGFLCNECGYCKYTRFSFVFSAKPSFASEKIETEEDQEKALEIIDKESSTAHQRYQQLQNYQNIIIHIFSKFIVPTARMNVPQSSMPRESSIRSPVSRGYYRRTLGNESPTRMTSVTALTSSISNSVVSVATLYNKECKSSFQTLCKSILILFATRRELARYHSNQDLNISITDSSKYSKPSNTCFGCANSFILLCLEFLESLLDHENIRIALVNHGVIGDVMNSNPIVIGSNNIPTANVILCRLVRNLPDATATLNMLLADSLDTALNQREQLTFREFPYQKMQLLCQITKLLDSCWFSRLKVLLALILRCVREALEHPVICEHILLPGLRVLGSLCDPENTTTPPHPATAHPTISLNEFQGATNAFTKWKEEFGPFITEKQTISHFYRVKNIFQVWKRTAGVETSPHCALLGDKNWIIQLVLSSTSAPIRKEASQLLTTLAGNASRSLSILNNCRMQLNKILWLGESSNEFFTLFSSLLDQHKGHREYLVLRGFLEEVTQLIGEQVARIRSLEQRQTLDIAQGFVLDKLVRILVSFLVSPGIARKFNELELVAPLLDNYLSLRSVIRQRTKLIDETCKQLIDLLTSLHGENLRERERFVVACINALRKHNHEARTPLFIVEQLHKIISPEEEEPERLLVLFKSPTQDDYIRGSMNKNPYSSKECGPLMRDVKNKICRDLELLGLLEDDNGMELLVCNKIIKLDLSVSEVYEHVWIKEKQLAKDTNQPMVIVFRLQGLDGEATEELVDSINNGEDEKDTDPEEEYKITLAIGKCGGLDVLLSVLQQVDMKNDHELANCVLKVLTLCCMVKSNRVYMLSNYSVPTLLEKLKIAFSCEALTDTAENLLVLLESIISEATTDGGTNNMETDDTKAAEEATRQMSMFLEKLNAPLVRNNPRIVECITHILPVLTYGYKHVAEILVDFFTKIPWTSLDEEQDIYEYLLTCFINVTKKIKDDTNGMKLREIFLERNITTVLIAYLGDILPVGCVNDSSEWNFCVERYALSYVLISLSGLVRGFAPAQQLVLNFPSLLPGLEQLSTISTKEKLGNHAENLIDSLCHNNKDVTAAVENIRLEAKKAKEEIARKHREKVLEEMGMTQKPGVSIGKVVAKSETFDWNAALLEDDEEFVCKVCKEGYSYMPDKILGFYVYVTKASLGNRKDQGLSTVTSFNIIHQTCHMEAARADAQRRPQPKSEWDGAMLRNSSTLCNNIFPILGPQTDIDRYSAMVEKYWLELPTSHGGISLPSRVRLLTHDLKLLIWRFATEASFSDESKGGGKESNIRMIPFFIQMGMYLMDSTELGPQRASFEESLSSFLRGEVPLDGRTDNAVYFTVLSLFLMNRDEWDAWRVFIMRQLIAVGTSQGSTNTDDMDTTDDSGNLETQWKQCKPYLLLFRVVQEIHTILKKKGNTIERSTKISHLPNDNWILDVKKTLRDNGYEISEQFGNFVSEFENALLPISSFEEMIDDCELLPTIISEYTSVKEFIISKP